MFPDATFQPLLILGAAALLVGACWHDLATRTLPDAVSVIIALGGLLSQSFLGDPLWSLAAAGFVFLGASLIWYFGAMGGGDVKLLGACALLVGASAVPTLILSTALAGGVLATVYLAGRRWPPLVPAAGRGAAGRVWRAEMWRIGRGGPLPYALAIASGTLFTLMDRV